MNKIWILIVFFLSFGYSHCQEINSIQTEPVAATLEQIAKKWFVIDYKTTAELTPGQEKSFFIVATPSNSTMKISAAIIRLRNEDFDVAEVTSISPVAGILPVVLKPLAEEVKNQSLIMQLVLKLAVSFIVILKV